MTPLLRFADAAYLLLLAVVPALAYWYVTRARRQIGSLRFSSLAAITRADRRRGDACGMRSSHCAPWR